MSSGHKYDFVFWFLPAGTKEAMYCPNAAAWYERHPILSLITVTGAASIMNGTMGTFGSAKLPMGFFGYYSIFGLSQLGLVAGTRLFIDNGYGKLPAKRGWEPGGVYAARQSFRTNEDTALRAFCASGALLEGSLLTAFFLDALPPLYLYSHYKYLVNYPAFMVFLLGMAAATDCYSDGG